MDIILTKDVANLGLTGQVLTVAPGYARNYLLPNGSALAATPANLKSMARKRAEFEARAKEAKDQALDFKARLAGVALTLVRKAGDKGKLYGAVTPQDLVEAAAAAGLTIDRKRLRLAEPIKTVGDFEVSLRLHPEVLAAFKVKVLAEGTPAKEPAQETASAEAAAEVPEAPAD
ncbi:MAG: 50S ribosomal protein L9 [Deltaproteobacteria bacterium]|jgi:large subunit ribosomal protein L9|nr:50S ribosomal protein L9 [Deltaproteobacteria bacterium]